MLFELSGTFISIVIVICLWIIASLTIFYLFVWQKLKKSILTPLQLIFIGIAIGLIASILLFLFLLLLSQRISFYLYHQNQPRLMHFQADIQDNSLVYASKLPSSCKQGVPTLKLGIIGQEKFQGANSFAGILEKAEFSQPTEIDEYKLHVYCRSTNENKAQILVLLLPYSLNNNASIRIRKFLTNIADFLLLVTADKKIAEEIQDDAKKAKNLMIIHHLKFLNHPKNQKRDLELVASQQSGGQMFHSMTKATEKLGDIWIVSENRNGVNLNYQVGIAGDKYSQQGQLINAFIADQIEEKISDIVAKNSFKSIGNFEKDICTQFTNKDPVQKCEAFEIKRNSSSKEEI